MLGWWRRLQKVHRWRFCRVLFGEGHSETEFLPRIEGTFRTTYCDDPHPDVMMMMMMMTITINMLVGPHSKHHNLLTNIVGFSVAHTTRSRGSDGVHQKHYQPSPSRVQQRWMLRICYRNYVSDENEGCLSKINKDLFIFRA